MNSISFGIGSSTRSLNENQLTPYATSQRRSAVSKLFDKIADFFCGTNIAKVKKDLWITFGSQHRDSQKFEAFTRIKDSATDAHKDAFKVQTHDDDCTIPKGSVKLSVVVDNSELNSTIIPLKYTRIDLARTDVREFPSEKEDLYDPEYNDQLEANFDLQEVGGLDKEIDEAIKESINSLNDYPIIKVEYNDDTHIQTKGILKQGNSEEKTVNFSRFV
jgi:hypothetical protein